MEVLVLSLIVGLALANGFKAIDNVRGTLQIARVYHTARVKHPEALGSDPEAARTTIAGFLATIIGRTMIHSVNLVICVMLGLSVLTDAIPDAAGLRFVLWILAPISALGSIGLAGTLVFKWLASLHDERVMDEFLKAYPKQIQTPKMQASDHAVILLGMTNYVVTALAAAYLMFLLYHSA